VVGYRRFKGPFCLHTEDGGIRDVWNVGILPQHYTESRCRWRQHGPLKRWYPTTTLHGMTSQKISTWIYNLKLIFR